MSAFSPAYVRKNALSLNSDHAEESHASDMNLIWKQLQNQEGDLAAR
jgi:hypothetical protein